MNPLSFVDYRLYNMTQYCNFQNIFKKERNKKAYSRFVNAFSWISKNYDFRCQKFCHIDVVLPYFCFRCGDVGGAAGGMGASGTVSKNNVLIQKSEIQRQQCSYDALAIKNNEAVLVIK